jgi:histidinol-phosphate aminotransferase
MYEVAAKIQGAEVVRVPLILDAKEVLLNEKQILQAIQATRNRIKILFLCSPNNPTGTLFEPEVLNRILKATRNLCLVALDEAYSEFTENVSLIGSLNQFPHLVILRTLSKAWALAGVRCGVALAQKEIIQLLQKIKSPYPLSTPAIQAVLAATDAENQVLLHQRVSEAILEREWVRNELLQIKSVRKIYPSSANFLLIQFDHSDQIWNNLKSHGMILRNRNLEPGLRGCIRMTIGTREENSAVISIIQKNGVSQNEL